MPYVGAGPRIQAEMPKRKRKGGYAKKGEGVEYSPHPECTRNFVTLSPFIAVEPGVE